MCLLTEGLGPIRSGIQAPPVAQVDSAIGYARLFHGGSLLASLRPRLLTTRVPRAVRRRRSQISTVSGTSPCAGAGAGLILLRKAEDIA